MATILDSADIDHCVAIADNLARQYVGVPEGEMLRALPALQTGLAADVVDVLGAEAAAIFAQAFVATVVRRRWEIESTGAEAPTIQ